MTKLSENGKTGWTVYAHVSLRAEKKLKSVWMISRESVWGLNKLWLQWWKSEDKHRQWRKLSLTIYYLLPSNFQSFSNHIPNNRFQISMFPKCILQRCIFDKHIFKRVLFKNVKWNWSHFVCFVLLCLKKLCIDSWKKTRNNELAV